MAETEGNAGTSKGRKRTRKVRSYPVHPLREALSVAQAIQDANSGLPFDRIVLAGELRTTPSSSGFTMRLNSSKGYGLTIGGYNHTKISLTESGRAVVAPKSEEERRQALVECALRPDVFRSFYESLEGRRMPQSNFAKNILERDHSIDPDLADECLNILIENGRYVGVLREVGGSLWVSVKSVRASEPSAETPASRRPKDSGETAGPILAEGAGTTAPTPRPALTEDARIFVGHFGCPQIAGRIQTLLSDLGIDSLSADVAPQPSASPLTEETSQAMGRCSAAVLVSDSSTAEAPEAALGFMAGAAAALYGARLLVVSARGAGGDDLAVPSVDLPMHDSDSAWSVKVLTAMTQAGVIRVSA